MSTPKRNVQVGPLIGLAVLETLVVVLLGHVGIAWLKPLPVPLAVICSVGLPCLHAGLAGTLIGSAKPAQGEVAWFGGFCLTGTLLLICLLPSASTLDVAIPAGVLLSSVVLRLGLQAPEGT